MISRRELVNRDVEPNIYQGTIVGEAETAEDLVRVKIPAIAEDFTTSPLEWDVRVDGVRPSDGNLALVAIDDQGADHLLKFYPTPS